MRNDDYQTIRKIVEYCETIESLLEEYQGGWEEFQRRASFQLSCSMCIIQIGELVGRLSDDFRSAHEDIPWYEIKALRNLHAHDYENVNMELVWEALTIDVPELKKNLEVLL